MDSHTNPGGGGGVFFDVYMHLLFCECLQDSQSAWVFLEVFAWKKKVQNSVSMISSYYVDESQLFSYKLI